MAVGPAVDLKTSVAGVEWATPLLVPSGAHTRNGKVCAEMAGYGVAAVTTKTIVQNPSRDALPCFWAFKGGFINCVFGSDLAAQDWFDREIPRAKSTGLVVIANVAGQNVVELAQKAEKAGADIIELGTGCPHMGEILEAVVPGLKMPPLSTADPSRYLANIKAVKEVVSVPVVVKLGATYHNVAAEWGKAFEEAGADGIICADALGPVLAIDIETGQPVLGGPRGVGSLTGQAIKPVVLRMVLDLVQNTNLPVIGVGGIATWRDAVEYIMAGATAVGVCTTGHLKGPKAYRDILDGLTRFMRAKGYSRLSDFRGLTLKKIQQRKEAGTRVIQTPRLPVVRQDLCSACGLCVTSCVYGAAAVEGDEVRFDRDLCHGCGLCASVCPTGALSFDYYG